MGGRMAIAQLTRCNRSYESARDLSGNAGLRKHTGASAARREVRAPYEIWGFIWAEHMYVVARCQGNDACMRAIGARAGRTRA